MSVRLRRLLFSLRSKAPAAVVCGFLLVTSLAARATVQTWNADGLNGGDGVWDAGVNSNWNIGDIWANGNDAVFTGAGATVTLASPYPSAKSLTFNGSGPYLLTGGALTLTSTTVAVNSSATIATAITSTVGLVKTGTGTLTLTVTAALGSNNLTVELGTVAIASGCTLSNGSGIIGNNIGSSGTVTVSGNSSKWTGSGSHYVGNFGTGMLMIDSGGSVSTGSYYNAYIGEQPGSNGTVTVSGASSTWTDNGYYSSLQGQSYGGALYVGDSGTGALTITGGGTVSNGSTSGASAIIGNSLGSTGTVTVSGNGSKWTDGGSHYVGNLGAGMLMIDSGATVSTRVDAFIGNAVGSSGTVGVSGNGSSWTITGFSNINGRYAGNLYVGASGTGTLTITGGGLVSSGTVGGGSGIIGNDVGSAGTVTVSGNGSKWADRGNLYVGNLGAGKLMIDSGGTVSTRFDAIIGNAVGSSGTAAVSGNGSSWAVTGFSDINGRYAGALYVGASGTGTMTITGGGTVSNGAVAGASAFIGTNAGSTGNVTVSGNGSTWTDAGNLYVGNSGTGTLTINSGGTVSDQTGYIANSASSSGMVVVSGTGSKWTNSGAILVANAGAATLMITSGGAVSNGDGYIASSASCTGVVTVSGSGSKWTNSGALTVGNSGTGTLTISNGGLVTVGGATTINSTGTLQFDGSGKLTAGSLVVAGGTLRPVGTGTFANSITISTGGMFVDSNGFKSTFSGVVSGSLGGLTKLGDGTLKLSGSNTYTAGTTINAGTVQLGNANGLGNATGNSLGVVTINAGTLDLSGFNPRLGALTGSSGAVITSIRSGTTATLTTYSTQGSNYAGSLTDGTGLLAVLALVKTGTGVQILSGSNSYSGGTTINSAGNLQLGNAYALGATTGNLAVNYGTLDLHGFSITVGSLSVGAAGVITTKVPGLVVLTANGSSVTTYSGTLTDGSGQLAFVKGGAGTLGLSSSSSYSGGTTVNAGTLYIGSAGTLGPNVNTNNITVNPGGNLALATAANVGSNQTASISSSAGALGGIGVGYTPASLSALTSGTVDTAGTGANGGVFGINYAGTAGITSLAALDTALNAGVASGHWFLGAQTTGTFNGATLDPASDDIYRLGGGGGTLALSATTVFASATAAVQVGSTSTNGNGKVVLSASNSYTGGTTINGGTLQFAKSVAMPSAGTVTTGSGAILAVNVGGAGEFTYSTSGVGSIGALLSGTGGQGAPVTWAAGSILGLDTTSASGTYSGAIANSGANSLGLAKLGTGTLTLTASNTYTGATNANSGTLNVNNFLASQSLTVASGATLNLNSTAATGTASAVNVSGLASFSGTSAAIYKVGSLNILTSGTAVLTAHTGGKANVKILDLSALTFNGTTTGTSGFVGGGGKPANSFGEEIVDSTAYSALAEGSPSDLKLAGGNLDSPAPVPEPGTIGLIVVGAGVFVLSRRRF